MVQIQLVLEFCDRGCLRDVLDAGVLFGAGGLNYHAILDTAADVAKAMLHLHLNDVLHGDLKVSGVTSWHVCLSLYNRVLMT